MTYRRKPVSTFLITSNHQPMIRMNRYVMEKNYG